MKKVLIYFNFIVVSTMVITGFIGASSLPQLMAAIIFFPLALYFWLLVVPKKKTAIIFPEILPSKGQPVIKLKKAKEGRLDLNRRTFLKLVGTAGVTLFLFSIFTKRAHGAFFGSIPGPGTIAIKDSTGAVIDPAIKTPTDGYKINQVDDSSPAYYGFTNKDGAWFIMKEDTSTGDYRYTIGPSDFTNATTGWPNRAALTYDYFENVF
ncbi:MAG: hypothetical protein UX13_C0010G0007 [Candidatus Woesebacteria bacterium GW2011_GWB1_45_5]|uniref:Uncharacterized protein n=1 Tax=Candidatus Woesebacteria bacterium GW2011_GWB1_45_5 TaxID=1618581 RepID=A0A0G1MQV6_9BACT|nr:MAG: hypothetical protein UX13_C0010G0007 [Candidatus Woesebacteria bacterium GW2011_GWB1_45_5]